MAGRGAANPHFVDDDEEQLFASAGLAGRNKAAPATAAPAAAASRSAAESLFGHDDADSATRVLAAPAGAAAAARPRPTATTSALFDGDDGDDASAQSHAAAGAPRFAHAAASTAVADDAALFGSAKRTIGDADAPTVDDILGDDDGHVGKPAAPQSRAAVSAVARQPSRVDSGLFDLASGVDAAAARAQAMNIDDISSYIASVSASKASPGSTPAAPAAGAKKLSLFDDD